MPTYDYECQACGHTFEKFQSITARTIRKCPKCGKMELQRLIGTGAGIIFKGSGFYQTDYRSQSYRQAAERENKAASGEKSTKSPESKPASDEAGSSGTSSKDGGKS